MTIVVKLGGTNGSGKTAVARALIGMQLENEVSSKANYGFIHNLRWSILGSYRNSYRGMDTINDKIERLELVRNTIEGVGSDVVFFEGLITGKTYGAFGAMSDEPAQKGKWIYAFMDTPFDVCVDRVLQRRALAAQAKGRPQGPVQPFNPERTMRPTYKAVHAAAKRALAAGHRVLWLPHQYKPPEIAQILVDAVENHKCR